MTKKPTKKPALSASAKSAPAARPSSSKAASAKGAPPAKPMPPALARRLPTGFPTFPSDNRLEPGKDETGKKKLSKKQIDAIRLLAIAMAGPDLGSDAVMICNPITEEPALPLSELLYDRCKWCEVDIYYDRLMPSPLGMMRVCLKCGILLLEAEKKGAN
jgi:hypothetical protein